MTKIRSKQQLVEAAARVFEEKGYAATRIEDVAAELGVMQGSLYYHVGSKAALHRLVVQHHLGLLITGLTAIVESPADPSEKLRLAILSHLTHVEKHLLEAPGWFSDPTRSADITDEETAAQRDLVLRYRAGWARIVEEAVARREIAADTDATAVAVSLISMCDYVPYWFRRDGEKRIEEVAALQHAIVWSGIALRRGD
ncbi:TetR/AcrR family transcriptional regulator [Pseudonocardia sp.]|jgi:AcrR family transcriptional regulator|uniref:TetR/AcrR family transcriptional regulator n=1 Tax=Pseudonocardia sp. TaxID=60912 RepID=UPI003D09EAB8